jgi:hypothetical protein
MTSDWQSEAKPRTNPFATLPPEPAYRSTWRLASSTAQALELGRAHEDDASDNNPAERRMDLHNNRAGARIGGFYRRIIGDNFNFSRVEAFVKGFCALAVVTRTLTWIHA